MNKWILLAFDFTQSLIRMCLTCFFLMLNLILYLPEQQHFDVYSHRQQCCWSSLDWFCHLAGQLELPELVYWMFYIVNRDLNTISLNIIQNIITYSMIHHFISYHIILLSNIISPSATGTTLPSILKQLLWTS